MQHVNTTMSPAPVTRVLVLDDDAFTSHSLATFLSARHYDVQTCPDARSADDLMTHWRPHVLVLAPHEGERHAELEGLRRAHPRLPLVVLTANEGLDLLLDLEAFAPALPARPSRGLSNIESAVATAVTFV